MVLFPKAVASLNSYRNARITTTLNLLTSWTLQYFVRYFTLAIANFSAPKKLSLGGPCHPPRHPPPPPGHPPLACSGNLCTNFHTLSTCKVLPFYDFWLKFYDDVCSPYPIVNILHILLITKIGNRNITLKHLAN